MSNSSTARAVVRRCYWGGLQHHDSPCPECAEEHPEDVEACSQCHGEGVVRWGSFYEQDRGECDFCHRARRIAQMYEGGGWSFGWVCLRCYVKHHAEQCGCDLWRDIELASRLRNETSGRSTLGEVEQSSGSAPPPESAGERAIGHDPLADRVPGESANLATLHAVASAARTAAEQVGGPAASGLLRLAEALEMQTWNQ